MSTVTPRRSTRIPHTHTPKMAERKKGLFQMEVEEPRESLTRHRRLPVVESESDSDECDLGIISTLDSSSGEEQHDQNAPKTPERNPWVHETRSQTKRLLKENSDLKNFIKSPFTLNKYQTRYSHPDSKCLSSVSSPGTPRVRHNPTTPSSTHSCASAHTTSSTSSRARKSLASLIADTESCSSSLKDLNFDSDSNGDSKENTPTKSTRKSNRLLKMTPKLSSFKGVLMEQAKNVTSPIVGTSPKVPTICHIKMDINSPMSPTQMLKTPHNTSENAISSPPKINHRKPVIEIDESPEPKCDSEKSHKRLRNDSLTENGPNPKYLKLDSSVAPKARLQLFNSDRLKEILSAKSFYGKSSTELNTSFTTKIANAIVNNTGQYKRHILTTQRRKQRRPGQINMGVRHKIRKPKMHKRKVNYRSGPNTSYGPVNSTVSDSDKSMNNSSMIGQNSSQEIDQDKIDPFDSEKQTIDALLSQWTEEDVPESELTFTKPVEELPCFSKTVIEETSQIFQPVTAVPVSADAVQPQNGVLVELGGSTDENATSSEAARDAAGGDVVMSEPAHGAARTSHFLPVDGGYILVDDDVTQTVAEGVPDLDALDRELRALDDQILQMAADNNIDPAAVLAPDNHHAPQDIPVETADPDVSEKPNKLFPIFSNPNPGTSLPSTKVSTPESGKKCVLKSVSDQYVIDAGQKRFGATQCTDCGVIYEIGDPQDEHDHLVHHNATDVLRFNGWKEERVVGRWGAARCVCVRGGDVTWKRVNALLDRVVHPQLGYAASLLNKKIYTYTAYLYVEKRQIIGCLIVEPKARAHRLLPGEPDCCSVEDYPVKCGVSRIWTHAAHRRRGVARRLLDCARGSFLYGDAIGKEHVAFSAPTLHGKALASNYCGTDYFYVYME